MDQTNTQATLTSEDIIGKNIQGRSLATQLHGFRLLRDSDHVEFKHQTANTYRTLSSLLRTNQPPHKIGLCVPQLLF